MLSSAHHRIAASIISHSAKGLGGLTQSPRIGTGNIYQHGLLAITSCLTHQSISINHQTLGPRIIRQFSSTAPRPKSKSPQPKNASSTKKISQPQAKNSTPQYKNIPRPSKSTSTSEDEGTIAGRMYKWLGSQDISTIPPAHRAAAFKALELGRQCRQFYGQNANRIGRERANKVDDRMTYAAVVIMIGISGGGSWMVWKISKWLFPFQSPRADVSKETGL